MAKVGRPAGSGAQLPGGVRARQSRNERLQAGAVRLEVTLNADTMAGVNRLVEHWGCGSKKEAVERAIAIAVSAVAPDRLQK